MPVFCVPPSDLARCGGWLDEPGSPQRKPPELVQPNGSIPPTRVGGYLAFGRPAGGWGLARSRPLARPCGPCSRCAGVIACAGS